MMRRIALCLLLAYCLSTSFAGYSDGFITAGEYEGAVTWRSFDPPLVVDGGGADRISVRDNGRLIVKSTSTPLGMDVGGVYDILLYNNAQLLYLDGVTELIDVGDNVKAVLMGGSINYIKSMKHTNGGTDQNVDLYCQLDSWSWINNDPFAGIQGLWLDGTPFNIKFINKTNLGYDPVWMNINIIPEPATFVLLAVGGFLLRRKK
jgi:hypothetical protein